MDWLSSSAVGAGVTLTIAMPVDPNLNYTFTLDGQSVQSGTGRADWAALSAALKTAIEGLTDAGGNALYNARIETAAVSSAVSQSITITRKAVLLNTQVNTVSVDLNRAGDVSLWQGNRALNVVNTAVLDGSFRLNAGAFDGGGAFVTSSGSTVSLDSVELESNRIGSDIVVSARGNITTRQVVAGVYLGNVNELGTIQSSSNTNTAVTVTSVTSAGSVWLTSATGSIRGGSTDLPVQLVGDRLTLRAATGITGLAVAGNTLDAVTTAGDIDIRDYDGVMEKTLGLMVVQANTSALGTPPITTASVGAQNTLIVKAPTTLGAAAVAGDTIRLTSYLADLQVETPLGSRTVTSTTPASVANDSLQYTKGVAFKAAKTVDLYRFFNAPELIEYRTGINFLFGETNGTKVGALPGNLTANSIILETADTLAINGTLTARDRVELISKRDVIVRGDIVAAAGAPNGEIGLVKLVAKGELDVKTFVDTNATGVLATDIATRGRSAPTRVAASIMIGPCTAH